MNEAIQKSSLFLFDTLYCPVAIIGSMAIDLHYKNQKQDQAMQYKQMSSVLININDIVYKTSQQDVDFIGYSKDFIDLRNDFPLFCVNHFHNFYCFYFEGIKFDFFVDQFHNMIIDTNKCIENCVEINQLPVLNLPCLLILKIQSANHRTRSLFEAGFKDIEDIIHIVFLLKNNMKQKDFFKLKCFIDQNKIKFVLNQLEKMDRSQSSSTNIHNTCFYALKNETIAFLKQLIIWVESE